MINIIEEHNEAFYKIVQSFNPNGEKYALLHIDEHHDFGKPIIKKDDLINYQTEATLKSIVYSQLRVSDYILPLFHLGIIDTSIWLSNNNNEYYSEFETYEELVGAEYIMIGNKTLTPNGKNNKFLEVNSDSNVLPFIQDKKVILSIDLDYFSCSDEEGERTVIEITEEEYKRFNSNVYHKSRLNFGSRVYCYVEKERYYMVHQHMDGKLENKIRTWDEINTKLMKLELFLRRNKIDPSIIIVCKSFLSGYTPNDYQNKILSSVIKILNKFSKMERI